MLEERTAISAFDAHYTYLGAWAMRHIVRQRPKTHVDVGGQIGWVACVAAVTPCVFIDIRPLRAEVPGLRSVAGSVLNMPFPDRSVESLSCLHVAEHIGLGRYGDPLDPEGTIAAIRELSRVLAPRGTLYFGTPVGRPQVVFNAHRVSSPLEIAHRFAAEGLTLQSFAWADDYDRFHESGSPADAVGSEYACGMYCFTRS
jgi:SAM-dependent methyltransferase